MRARVVETCKAETLFNELSKELAVFRTIPVLATLVALSACVPPENGPPSDIDFRSIDHVSEGSGGMFSGSDGLTLYANGWVRRSSAEPFASGGQQFWSEYPAERYAAYERAVIAAIEGAGPLTEEACEDYGRDYTTVVVDGVVVAEASVSCPDDAYREMRSEVSEATSVALDRSAE